MPGRCPVTGVNEIEKRGRGGRGCVCVGVVAREERE